MRKLAKVLLAGVAAHSMRAGRRNNRKFCGYNGKGAETTGNT